MPGLSLTFRPFLRQGLAATSTRAAGARWVTKKFSVRVTRSDGAQLGPDAVSEIERPVRGPGEVLGIEPSVVARFVPEPGDPEFPVNLFPFIELKDPDFPWRYSIDAPSKDDRLAPWIALLVVPKARHLPAEAFRLDGDHRGTKLRVQRSDIPDLRNLWAWAHVQSTAGVASSGWDDEPALHCSRILCPVKLEPGTVYTAMLVPAVEAGRRAALGKPVEAIHLRPWSADDADGDGIDLPVYVSWEFRTAEDGDFETLLDRVIERMGKQPRPDPGSLGIREIDGSDPGGVLANVWSRPGDTFPMTGALVAFGNELPPVSEGDREFAGVLRAELERELASGEGDDDPLIRLPCYGRAFAPDAAAALSDDPAGADAAWVARLNLLRRHRIAASIGAAAVRGDQEQLVRECWRQAGEVRRARQEVRTARIGELLGRTLREKHIDRLPPERAFFATEPAHHLAGFAGESHRAIFRRTGLRGGHLTNAARRILAQRVGYGDAPKRGRDAPPTAFQSFVRERIAPTGKERVPGIRDEIFQSPLQPDLVEVMPTPFDAASAEFTATLDSAADVCARLRATVTVRGEPVNGLDDVGFEPVIPVPTYEYLTVKGADALVPHLDGLENNTTAVLREDHEFIRSFLVGMNDEMNRELLWREFPARGPTTVFRRFWQSLDPDPAAADEIVDLRSWARRPLSADELAGTGGRGERVVFAIKADLVRRYPEFLLHLLRVDAGDGRPESDDGTPLAALLEVVATGNHAAANDAVFDPIFEGRADRGTRLFGFNVSESELHDGAHRWYFVISQPHSLPMFGLDTLDAQEPPETNVAEFSWWQAKVLEGGWISPLELARGNLLDAGKPVWTAANTSARIARCLYQKPYQAVIRAGALFPPRG